MEFLAAAYTDTGLSKETNQDSICLRRAMITGAGEMIMAVVCDGMGGLKKGEVASKTAVEAFGDWFDQNLVQFPTICGSDFSIVRRQWTALLDSLHQDLRAYSSSAGVSLGTTAAAMLTYADRYLLVNIGDSRVYEMRNDLRQLTQDQSLVAREIAMGRITEEESRHHPQRNILLQCIGAGDRLNPVFYEGKLQNGAVYLLCSDGLAHELSKSELSERLQTVFLNCKEEMTSVLRELTELCKQRGETDDITSILVRAMESPPLPKASSFQKLASKFHIYGTKNADVKSEATLIETAQIIHTTEVIGRNKRSQA